MLHGDVRHRSYRYGLKGYSTVLVGRMNRGYVCNYRSGGGDEPHYPRGGGYNTEWKIWLRWEEWRDWGFWHIVVIIQVTGERMAQYCTVLHMWIGIMLAGYLMGYLRKKCQLKENSSP